MTVIVYLSSTSQLVQARIMDSDSPNPNLWAIFAGERQDSNLYPWDSNLF
jgi:hypothetical protein